jgi:hypothetical protein
MEGNINDLSSNTNIFDINLHIQEEVKKAVEHLQVQLKSKDELIDTLKSKLEKQQQQLDKSKKSANKENVNKVSNVEGKKETNGSDTDVPAVVNKKRKKSNGNKSKQIKKDNNEEKFKSQNMFDIFNTIDPDKDEDELNSSTVPSSCEIIQQTTEINEVADNEMEVVNIHEPNNYTGDNNKNSLDIFKQIKFKKNVIISDPNVNDDADVPISAAVPDTIEETQEKIPDPVTVSTRKAKYCPPIVMYNTSVKDITQSLGNNVDLSDYKVVNVNRTKSKLYVKDPSVQKLIIDKIRESDEIEGHSHTDLSNRDVNLILRGVHFSFDEKEIYDEIAATCKNLKIKKVTRYYTQKSVKEKIQYNLFLVQLEPGQPTEEITSIKYICHQPVTWERPKKSKFLQCKRCQSFGHIAQNCGRNYRCMKCPDSHGPYECKITKTNKIAQELLYCCNCKVYGHPANYRGCEKYLDYKNRLKPKSNIQIPEKKPTNKIHETPKTSPVAQLDKSFADMTRQVEPLEVVTRPKEKDNTQKTTLNSEKPLGVFSQFKNLSNEIFDMDFITLVAKIKNFLNTNRNLSPLDRKLAYLDLLDNLNLNDD